MKHSLLLLVLFLFACNSSEDKQQAETTPAQNAETAQPDPLASWADAPKKRIADWVKTVTDSSSKDFIPIKDRIAVFDNDGTLWTEQPVPTQFYFAIDNLKAVAAKNPSLLKDPVIKGAVNNDMEPLKKAGLKGLEKVLMASHTNMTEDEFNTAVKNWVDTARDKRFHQPYTALVYQPMVELLKYLRANQFRTFIVSGGGADFMRVWTEQVYGIPPNHVIGSYGDVKFKDVNGKPVIFKTAGDIFVDDKAAKPAAIHRFIGQVPVLCGGNSDGDQAMMEYTSTSKYNTLCVLLHHTDAEREYAYDVKALSGQLVTALDKAKEKNWLVVDMKNDFKKIFPFEK